MTVVLILAVVVCAVWLIALGVRRRRVSRTHASVERFDRALAALAEPTTLPRGSGSAEEQDASTTDREG